MPSRIHILSANSLPTNLRAHGGPAGYAVDIQGNATLRWAAGNTQDISFEDGSAQRNERRIFGRLKISTPPDPL